ncbi:hypothetical protein [Streptomyces sp. NPDC001717]|uniref:hypothetical protein n=1 Tax=Streptomyces sp. NPDC001717 TaxID=3364604 RepID=UPI0036D19123
MTMPVPMTVLYCSQCPAGSPSSYRAEPTRLFRCLACGHLLDVRDLELDPEESWAVSRDGLLGYTVDEPEAVAYGLEGAFAAVHRGAALVLDGLTLSEAEAHAVTLAVCAVLTTLENPAATLDDVTRTCLESPAPEVAARFGWRVKPAAPEHRCPVCGGGVILASRGWASCASAVCSWGDMACELPGALPGWER